MKNNLPFNENSISENVKIREFDENVDSGELTWHRDREDRIVKVIEGHNWKLQLDNQLPVTLSEGKEYFIPKGEWHRVIKGNDTLKIQVTKL